LGVQLALARRDVTFIVSRRELTCDPQRGMN